jgi:hypothetical protein
MHPITASSGDDISIYRKLGRPPEGLRKLRTLHAVYFTSVILLDPFLGFACSLRRLSTVKFTDDTYYVQTAGDCQTSVTQLRTFRIYS